MNLRHDHAGPSGPLLPVAFLLFAAAGPLSAQGLPAWRPVNPAIASRSTLGFEPVAPVDRGWHAAVAFDYGNVLEAQTRTTADYILDAELARFEVSVGHGFGRWFVSGSLPVASAQAGGLDPFITWWHGVFGFEEARRDERANNLYEYFIEFPNDARVTRPAGGLGLGDLRLTVGVHHTTNVQTVLIASLPTGSRPDGWGLDAPSLGVTTTWRSYLVPDRLTYEGSAGLAHTARSGDLASYQRTVFASGSSGFRLRFLGQQWAYANVLFHTGAWRNTTLPALDNPDLSLDFGFLLKPGNGPEIVAGMVEDLYPYGPAVDLVFRLGVRW